MTNFLMTRAMLPLSSELRSLTIHTRQRQSRTRANTNMIIPATVSLKPEYANQCHAPDGERNTNNFPFRGVDSELMYR